MKKIFKLGDQSSNKCNFFEPSELAQTSRKTFKLDKVDWLCGMGHTKKGVAEGTANPCEPFGQTLENLLTSLSFLSNDPT